MNGLQISISNVIGQSNIGSGFPPVDRSKFIVSENDEHLITEDGNLKMIPEDEIVYLFTESDNQMITEKNKKLVTEI